MQITTEAEVQVTTPKECNWVVSLDDGGIVATRKADGRQLALTWEMAITAAWERYRRERANDAGQRRRSSQKKWATVDETAAQERSHTP